MSVKMSTCVMFVLGRGTGLDAQAIEAASAGAAEVVVLSLGYPISPAQQTAVDAALALAERSQVRVDAVLVTAPQDLDGLARSGARVVVDASPAERRRLRRWSTPV